MINIRDFFMTIQYWYVLKITNFGFLLQRQDFMPGLCGCFRFAKIDKIFDMGVISSNFNIFNVLGRIIISTLCRVCVSWFGWLRVDCWAVRAAPYSLFRLFCLPPQRRATQGLGAVLFAHDCPARAKLSPAAQ